MSFFLFNYLAQCKSMIQSSHDIKECGMSPTLSSMAFAKSLIYSSKGDLEIKYKQKILRCLKVVILYCKFCIFMLRFLLYRLYMWLFTCCIYIWWNILVMSLFVRLALVSSLVFCMEKVVIIKCTCLWWAIIFLSLR